MAATSRCHRDSLQAEGQLGTRHPIKYLLQMAKLHCSSLPNGANKTATVSSGGKETLYLIIIIGGLNLQSKLSMSRTVFDFQKNKSGLLVNK